MRVRAREKRGILVFSQFKIQPCQLLNLRCANLSVNDSKCSSKTTHRFMKSDVSFYGKWRVVLWEMTCCFMRNDVLFYEKRRVVLWETTCCFMRNDVLFVQDNILVVQFYDFALLRVRALFFVRSYRSPLRGRLTTLNNGIKPKSVIRPLLCNLLPRI